MKKLRSLQWLTDRFTGCRCGSGLLSDYRKAGPRVERLVRAAGLKIVGRTRHQFKDRGYTCVWLLSQSHVSLHSWPEYDFVTVGIEVCGFNNADEAKISRLHSSLERLFQPSSSRPRLFRFRFRRA